MITWIDAGSHAGLRAEVKKYDNSMKAADYSGRVPALIAELCRDCEIWQDRIELKISPDSDLYQLPVDARVSVVNLHEVYVSFADYLYQLENKRLGIRHANYESYERPIQWWMENDSLRIFPRPNSEMKLLLQCALSNELSDGNMVPKHLLDRYAFIVAMGVVYHHLENDTNVILQKKTENTLPINYLNAMRNFKTEKRKLKNQKRNVRLMSVAPTIATYG